MPLVVYKEGITGIADITDKAPLRIVPNPSSKWIIVEGTEPQQLMMYSVLGQPIRLINEDEVEKPIDISGLLPGHYFIRLPETGQVARFIRL